MKYKYLKLHLSIYLYMYVCACDGVCACVYVCLLYLQTHWTCMCLIKSFPGLSRDLNVLGYNCFNIRIIGWISDNTLGA